MIPDCDGRSDGQTESIIANTALCIARAMLTRCKNWPVRLWPVVIERMRNDLVVTCAWLLTFAPFSTSS